MQLTREPRARLQEITRVVASDAALAAQVLRISRSATYLARRESPRTLADAITAVGLDVLRRVLVVAAARSVHLVGDRVAQTLWDHALATALAADELGQLTGGVRGGPGFIAGLLHDMGKLVFHLSDRSAFARVALLDEVGERDLFGVTHAEVGGCLVERWDLEPALAQAISEHHLRPVSAGLAGTVGKADWIAHRIGFGSVQKKKLGPLETVDKPVDLDAVARRVAKAFDAERRFFG
jgi:HD-like signal output (HDOD) protein